MNRKIRSTQNPDEPPLTNGRNGQCCCRLMQEGARRMRGEPSFLQKAVPPHPLRKKLSIHGYRRSRGGITWAESAMISEHGRPQGGLCPPSPPAKAGAQRGETGSRPSPGRRRYGKRSAKFLRPENLPALQREFRRLGRPGWLQSRGVGATGGRPKKEEGKRGQEEFEGRGLL